MHNSPSEKLSGSSAPRKNSGFTHYKLPAAITIAGLAALFAMRGDDNKVEPAIVTAAAAKATDLDKPLEQNPASDVETVPMDAEGDAVTAQPVSIEKPIEKAPLKPGQPTIEELKEGIVPAGTQIRLRAGGQEGGQEYILVVDDKGLITINGKKYEQAAKAFKEFPFVGKKLVKTVVLKWSEVKKVRTEKGESVLEINGEPIDKSEEGKVDLYTEDELVSMGANADSGKLVKPLGKRLGENPLTGKKDVEVDVEWTIYPKK